MKIKEVKKANTKQGVSKYNLKDRTKNLAPLAGSAMMGAKELFLEREYYKDILFEDLGTPNHERNLLDSWNSMLPYGLLDPRGVPCVPTAEYMQQVRNADDEPVFVLNFVADAFDVFADSFGNMSEWLPKSEFNAEGSMLANPVARRGWESADDLYNAHMVGAVFDYFANTYVARRENSFTTFEEFVEVFARYVRMAATAFPITFSSFMKSVHCPPLASGLAIEIADEKAGDDHNKYKLFLSDPNYDFYRMSAEKNGFFVDKNIPWRLYANLNHDSMRKYMLLNGFFAAGKDGLRNLYQQAFYHTYFDDLEYLRFYMAAYYNAIVRSTPVVRHANFACRGTDGVVVSQHLRKKLQCFDSGGAIDETSEYVQRYGPLFWMKMYYCIRYTEEGIKMSKKQLDKNIIRFYNLYRLQGLDKTIYAINEEINQRLMNPSKLKRHKLMQQDSQKKKGTSPGSASTRGASGTSRPDSPVGGGGGGGMTGGSGGY